MPGNPRMRASDADRDRVADLLREHLAAGRLTQDEFAERLDQALSAKTMGELDELTMDLPVIDPRARIRPAGPPVPGPWPPGQPVPAGGGGRQLETRQMAWRATAVAVIVAGYVVSGAVFGVWWIPWWLLIVVPALILRRRYH